MADSPVRRGGWIAVVANERAGGALQAGGAEGGLREELMRLFAEEGVEARVTLAPAPQLARTLERAAAEGATMLVVAGGDGTVSRLLPTLLALALPVGILPLGTLNLLARDLGSGADLAENVALIARGELRQIDLGLLNDVPFHSISGLGFFGMMARERETARRALPFSKALGFAVAALRTTLFNRRIEVEIEAAGEQISTHADAVLVTNNTFDGTPWRRQGLADNMLEVHVLEAHGLGGRLRAALAIASGRWRELPHLTSVQARSLKLWRRDKRRSTVATDGETSRVTNPLRYGVLARALTVVAAPAESEAAGEFAQSGADSNDFNLKH